LFFYQDENHIIQPLKIANLSQTQPNLLLVDFEQVNNLSQAEKLKNKEIYCLTSDQLFIEKINYRNFIVA
jgi:ribosomal 30S subunit maturation factor RimM